MEMLKRRLAFKTDRTWNDNKLAPHADNKSPSIARIPAERVAELRARCAIRNEVAQAPRLLPDVLVDMIVDYVDSGYPKLTARAEAFAKEPNLDNLLALYQSFDPEGIPEDARQALAGFVSRDQVYQLVRQEALTSGPAWEDRSQAVLEGLASSGAPEHMQAFVEAVQDCGSTKAKTAFASAAPAFEAIVARESMTGSHRVSVLNAIDTFYFAVADSKVLPKSLRSSVVMTHTGNNDLFLASSPGRLRITKKTNSGLPERLTKLLVLERSRQPAAKDVVLRIYDQALKYGRLHDSKENRELRDHIKNGVSCATALVDAAKAKDEDGIAQCVDELIFVELESGRDLGRLNQEFRVVLDQLPHAHRTQCLQIMSEIISSQNWTREDKAIALSGLTLKS